MSDVVKYTEDECLNCCTADWAAGCGEMASLTQPDVDRLEQLGLLKQCPPPDDMPDAVYGYVMTEAGERLAADYRSGVYIPTDETRRIK